MSNVQSPIWNVLHVALVYVVSCMVCGFDTTWWKALGRKTNVNPDKLTLLWAWETQYKSAGVELQGVRKSDTTLRNWGRLKTGMFVHKYRLCGTDCHRANGAVWCLHHLLCPTWQANCLHHHLVLFRLNHALYYNLWLIAIPSLYTPSLYIQTVCSCCIRYFSSSKIHLRHSHIHSLY